jgi:hypothetical protein
MAGKLRTPGQLAAMRRAFHERAEAAFTAMFDPERQKDLVTFSEREDRACREGDALTRWLLEQHVQSDEAAQAEEEAECPLCGGPLALRPGEKPPERREVLTRRGKVAYERAARRCPRCRRVFFPPR